jgi:HSP20 family protein
MERSYGKFLRIVQLPVKVQDDRAKAEFKNGVLRITLPKTVETRKLTRKIEVKSD